MIFCEDLSKRFGDFVAVKDLNLEVEQGEIFGFLGPNGAGKTTTIRMLCGLVEPTAGRAKIGQYEVGVDDEAVRNAVGLLTEAPGLYELLNAYDNLMFYARLHQIEKKQAEKRVQETLEWLDLWERRKEPVGGFSKGMKQRLAIGRSLLHRPQVLFLDEPTAALDAESARAVRQSIVALKNAKRTIFLSTHNMTEADQLCDRIAIFKTSLIELDTPHNLRRRFGFGSQKVLVRLSLPMPENVLSAVEELDFVAQVQEVAGQLADECALEVTLADPATNNPVLIAAIARAGGQIRYLEEQTASLEDVYLSLTASRTKTVSSV